MGALSLPQPSAEPPKQDLWLRYFELGGMSTPSHIDAYLRGEIALSANDLLVLEQARLERTSDAEGIWTAPPAMPAVAALRLGLLGSFRVTFDDEPILLPLNAQRLVGFLALHEGTLLRQHVAGVLWGDTSERRADGSLRSALWRLGLYAHPVVEKAGAHLRLTAGVDVDLRASETLARRVLDVSQELSDTDVAEALRWADLLPDWSDDWVIARREYHAQLRLRVLDALSTRLTEAGRYGEGVQAGMLAVSVEPLRESAQRTLIAAHLAEGNDAAAVKQYESFRELLRDELDLAPSPAMQTLVSGLIR